MTRSPLSQVRKSDGHIFLVVVVVVDGVLFSNFPKYKMFHSYHNIIISYLSV